MAILAKSVGRRKEAVAQVQITRGTGQFIINNKPAQDYLQNDACSLLSVKAPFEILRVSTEMASASLVPLNAKVANKEEHEAGSEAMELQTENSLNALNIDTIVKVKGGGLMGQTEAIRLGIARAICLLSSGNQLSAEKGLSLNRTSESLMETGTLSSSPANSNPEGVQEGGETVATFLDVRKQLKDKGYLTQDSRVKERRKYGLKKARKASQYHKR